MAEAQQNVHSYRPINLDFLHKNETLAFDIYYRVKSIGEASFEKFASAADPRHREKVHKLLESGGGAARNFTSTRTISSNTIATPPSRCAPS